MDIYALKTRKQKINWKSAEVIETSYAMFKYLGGEFLSMLGRGMAHV